MLPVVAILLRLFATGALAGVAVSAHVAGNSGNAAHSGWAAAVAEAAAKTKHSIQLKEREERRKAAAEAAELDELKAELDVVTKMRHSMLAWTMTFKDELEVSPAMYKCIGDLLTRQLELKEKLGLPIEEDYSREGARRTEEQIAQLTSQ